MHRIDDIQAWLGELGAKVERVQRELVERNRELECMRASFDPIHAEAPLGELLQRIVDLIPSAFVDPEVIGARLTIADQTFVTGEVRTSRWNHSVGILAQGRAVGALSIHCYDGPSTSAEDPFSSPEKRRFFEVLAARVGGIVREGLVADQGRQDAEDLAVAHREIVELRMERTEWIHRLSQVEKDLSVPVLEVWDGVLVTPIFGIVDSSRAAQITDMLLFAIAEKQARFAIIDITGVRVIDTSTADHLMKMWKATQLLGVTCILTGVQPSVGQTLVELGVDFEALPTRGTLRGGLRECLRRMSAR